MKNMNAEVTKSAKATFWIFNMMRTDLEHLILPNQSHTSFSSRL